MREKWNWVDREKRRVEEKERGWTSERREGGREAGG